MKTKMLVLALITMVSAPVAAQGLTVSDLADETGLTERQVRMVMGGRTGYGEYRSRFNRVERQFRDALGHARYQDLVAGKPITLDRKTDAAQVANVDTGMPRTP
ncbi:MAG: hypothetical protein NVV60_07020 [Luteimonas sp.]|nr:hypothetical protein [Luteimonas sp.]